MHGHMHSKEVVLYIQVKLYVHQFPPIASWYHYYLANVWFLQFLGSNELLLSTNFYLSRYHQLMYQIAYKSEFPPELLFALFHCQPSQNPFYVGFLVVVSCLENSSSLFFPFPLLFCLFIFLLLHHKMDNVKFTKNYTAYCIFTLFC